MGLMFVVYTWYCLYQLRNKALCIYTRATTQEIEKFVGLKARTVVFDKMEFDILPERHRLKWKTVLGLFGTWVIAYHFVWNDSIPEDPNAYKIQVISPEVRHTMNQEKKFKAFLSEEAPKGVIKKSGGFMQYIPWFIICAVLIGVIYMMFTQGKTIALMNTDLQEVINSLPK
jgi:hypothetical protein